MSGGYLNTWLSVDLTTGEITQTDFPENVRRDYLGGYGLGARVLYDRMPAGVDALGPDNILGFLTGPLTGTPALIGSRFTVVAKSPLTGGWGDANCGGYFGPHLKFAGVDGIFLSGAASEPVYLLVRDGHAELRSAAGLWGKNAQATEVALKAEHGEDAQVACIGMAGEKQSLISCILTDMGRAAGRSGLGAVMGSKKLKAVVVQGDAEVPLAHPERAAELRREALKQAGGFHDLFASQGTCGVVEPMTAVGDAPIKNWAGAAPVDFDQAPAIGAEAIIPRQAKKYGCWRCPIACGGHLKPFDGQRVKVSHKPEYETIIAFGGLCLNGDVDSIITANDLCNDYGLDTISTGATIAFAIECYENGLLNAEDAEGLDLRWGNAAAIVALTEKMGRREGIGALLADGVRAAAEQIGKGAEEYAVHVGGQEPGMHDPKFVSGLAICGQLDATPGRHTQFCELYPPVAYALPEGDGQDPTSSQMAQNRKWLQRIFHVWNSAGLCMFGYVSYPLEAIPGFLAAVTGWDVDLEECLRTGERIANMRHMFNLREGLNPMEHQIPGRWVGRPPLEQGPLAGTTVDTVTMNRQLLELLEWDPVTALPSEARLIELGLQDLAQDLAQLGQP